MKPQEQADTLRRLVGLDFSALETNKQKIYDQRTEINREVARDRARLVKLPEIAADVPDLPTPMQTVLDEIKTAREKNLTADALARLAIDKKNRHDATMAAVREAEAQISAWQKTYAERQQAAEGTGQDATEAELHASQAERVNTAELEEKLVGLEARNAAVKSKQERAACVADIQAAEGRSAALTNEIEVLDQKKAQALREAQFPLEGLSFDDGGVFFKGQPFSQISDGEKLRVSVSIGMALNPTLRVIFVRDGALLDREGLKLIASMAQEKDYQVWMEDARSEDPAAIIIENGEVCDVPSSFDQTVYFNEELAKAIADKKSQDATND
jgi:hypothetical protein